MIICHLCGKMGFKDFKEYDKHHRQAHGVRASESTFKTFTVHSTAVIEPINLTGRTKTQIIEDTETKIRNLAWEENRLNPLLGTTNTSCEPIWDKDKNVL